MPEPHENDPLAAALKDLAATAHQQAAPAPVATVLARGHRARHRRLVTVVVTVCLVAGGVSGAVATVLSHRPAAQVGPAGGPSPAPSPAPPGPERSGAPSPSSTSSSGPGGASATAPTGGGGGSGGRSTRFATPTGTHTPTAPPGGTGRTWPPTGTSATATDGAPPG